MDNQEFENIIAIELSELSLLNENAIKIARNVIGETLFKTDLYFCSMLNKSLKLTDGFIDLVKKRNLTCAGILLRANMDNCLRMYAMFIAEDPDVVIDYIITGKKIDSLKDKNGKRLKDWYLREQLEKYDNKFSEVYKNVSGYVHFSEKGFFQSVSALDREYTLAIQVSHKVPEKANEFIIECVKTYAHFLQFFYSMFKDIIRVKNDYDKSQEEVDI